MAIPNIDDSYPVAPLENLFNLIGDGAEADIAALQAAIANKLQRAFFLWANAAARTAQTGMVNGDSGYQLDTASTYTRVSGAWVRNQKTYVWADSTARGAQTGMASGDAGQQLDTGTQYQYNGTVWKAWESEWISWATAPTNITVGTGGLAAAVQEYKYIAGRVLFRVKYILGTSGASMGTGPAVNLPFSLILPSPRFAELMSAGTVYDVSVPATFQARARINVAVANQIIITTYTGTHATITNAAPMSWGAGDELAVEFWGDPA